MCPNEIIHRLLDMINLSLPAIQDEKILERIVSELALIKNKLIMDEIDERR